MKQPMAGVAVLLALGIWIGAQIPASPLWVIAAALLAGGAVFAGFQHDARWLAASLILAGWANVAQRTAVLSPRDLRETTSEVDQLVTVLGTLAETPQLRVQESGGKRFIRSQVVLDARRLQGPEGLSREVFGKVMVSTSTELGMEFHSGRAVAISGVMRRPSGPQAPRLFDYRNFLGTRGIHRELRSSSAADWKLIDSIGYSTRPWPDRFQAWARATLARGLPEEDDALRLLWAMALGWKTGMTDEVREPFLRSGTMHVFAISGLHVALIAFVLLQALRLVLLPRFIAGLLALPTIWLYVVATGLQSSAIRSALMISIIIASWMVHRPVDVLNSLATAAFCVLAWDPCQLFQAGFQLSFAVVASIGLLAPPFEARLRGAAAIDPFLPDETIPGWRRAVYRAWGLLSGNLAVSVAAWIGSVPLSAWYFHLLSLSGLVVNLAIVPLSSLALASCLASLACGEWLPSVGVCFNHGAWFWMSGMLAVSRWSAELPYGCWHMASPPVAAMALAFLVLILVGIRAWEPPRWRRPLVVALGFLILVTWAEWRTRQVDIRIGILSMRGGHSVCVQTSQKTSVIDAGDLPGASGLVHPYLMALGINRIDQLWLTHGDVRHVGGALELIRRYRPTQVAVSPVKFRSGPYRQTLEQIRTQSPDRLKAVSGGETVGPWRILHPERDDAFSQADDGSLVLQMGLGRESVLLLGDLGRPGQELLMRRHPGLRARIVISGVPVRGEPLCDGLLDQLQPDVILVADALLPATARSSAQCKNRLRRRTSPTLFLSESGSLELRHKNGRWEILDATGKLLFPGANEIGQLRTNPGSFPVTR